MQTNFHIIHKSKLNLFLVFSKTLLSKITSRFTTSHSKKHIYLHNLIL